MSIRWPCLAAFLLLTLPIAAQDSDPFERRNAEFLEMPESAEDAGDQTGLKPTSAPSLKPASAPTRSAASPASRPTREKAEDESPSRLSDEPRPLMSSFPRRPVPLLELGNSYLGSGPISFGFEAPGGSVWQPSLLVHGSLRSAWNAFRVIERGSPPGEKRDEVEWVNRLDIFADLQLAGFNNERFVFGMRPLDRALGRGDFTGYRSQPDDDPRLPDGDVNGFSGRIVAAFFEGDIGELLPFLDPGDKRNLDIGFSVGRQALRVQAGALVDDIVDGAGLTKNNIAVSWANNLRVTAFCAWGEIHRGETEPDDSATLMALFSSADFVHSTVDLDIVYASDSELRGGDSVHAGLSAVQRLWVLDSTLRALVSVPTERDEPRDGRGVLLMAELSWEPTATDDVLYLSAFLGIDHYRQALRSPGSAGPLQQVGLAFAGPGLGRIPSALDGSPDRAVGGALGYQLIIAQLRQQWIIELAGRRSTTRGGLSSVAASGRFQQAFLRRFVLRIDGYLRDQESEREDYGGHFEVALSF